jgi:CheY-like chemotaxis protein
MVDDDEDDRLLFKKAWDKGRLGNDLRFVEDGQEAMDYLHHLGKYTDYDNSPRPGLILLDLNMPKKSGHEVLKEIKADPGLRKIPVVVLTTSQAEADLIRTYDLGSSSFVRKPVTFDSLLKVVRDLGQYWLVVSNLPSGHSHQTQITE